MSEESGQRRRHHRRRRLRSRERVKRVLVAICILVVLVAAGYFIKTLIGSVPEVPGVWKGNADGRTYEIDRQNDGYLLAIDGRRLPVQSAEINRRRGEVRLRVQTGSGLVANWTLNLVETPGSGMAIHLDKDGLASETLTFKHVLSPGDRQRLQTLTPDTSIRWSPSFDCTKAETAVQRMLCTDRALAASDVRLAALAKAAGKDDQEAALRWEKAIRDVCVDLACLRDAYSARMVALNIKRDAEDVARIERTLDLANQLSGMTRGGTVAAPGATAPAPDPSDEEDDSDE
ncbi:MAG TPA: hypothetical protein VFW42_00930 [Fluviicoccus sp.]|nr:hypothetical protein [Fluviicoccus sp.]